MDIGIIFSRKRVTLRAATRSTSEHVFFLSYGRYGSYTGEWSQQDKIEVKIKILLARLSMSNGVEWGGD